MLIFLSRWDFEYSEILLATAFPLLYVAVAASLSRHRISHPRIYVFCLSLAIYFVYFTLDSQLGLFSLPSVDGQHYRVVVTEEPEFLVLGTFAPFPLLIFSLLALLLMYLIFRLFPKKPQSSY